MLDVAGHRLLKPGAALAVLVAALLASLIFAGGSSAASFRPPAGKTFHGVSDTGDTHDFNKFSRQVRAHPALLQDFFHWNVPLSTGALDRWQQTNTRGVLSLSTAPGGEPEIISPKRIADGHGDHYLLRLNESIAHSKQIVYIRPFGEMNLHFNPYCAFNADGSKRHNHSTRWFKRAWRRMVIIIKGGKRSTINAKLRKQGLPRIYRAKSNKSKIYRRKDVPHFLDHPKVAFMWTPQTSGSPDVRGNQPRNYFPGGKYVDWVGADAYSKYANHTLWKNLGRFYRKYNKWPFVIGEYGPWDNDTSGHFTRRIFRWAKQRKRVDALNYFRSNDGSNVYNVQYYPGAKRSLRHLLKHKRYMQYAPGSRKNHH